MLIVCTGNQCRSPMAAGLLARRLADAGVSGRVRSAGLMAGGQPATPEAAEVLRSRGVDLDHHRSRRLDRSELAGADLVIGMTREHVREAVALEPAAWPRAFTLKELVRRGTGVGPRERGESLADWLERAGERRTRTELLGSSTLDDIPDPIGQPVEVYEHTARELDHLTGRLVALLWPDPGSGR